MNETTDFGTRKIVIAGTAAVAVMFGVFGVWAATTKISSAVIANGMLSVASVSKKVQHPEGGIVSSVLVKNGSQVRAGQTILRLDDTKTSAELSAVRSRLTELLIRRARLEAERDGVDKFTLPRRVEVMGKPENYALIYKAQRSLLVNRVRTLSDQLQQVDARIAQFKDEIDGIDIQLAAKKREMLLLAADVGRYEELDGKRLTPKLKLHESQRMQVRVAGERGRLRSQAAQIRGRIVELKMRASEMIKTNAAKVLGELNEVEATLAELTQKEISIADRLRRLDVRAPISGRIHELAVHTVGGVIKNAETLMKIVPQNDALVVEARVRPQDIDEVHAGMNATVRMSAFNQRTTPELLGKVDNVSPEQSTDDATGMQYFTVRVVISVREYKKLGANALRAGMPVEVLIKGGERTVISFFTKPLVDQLQRAFREQ